jgi:hypothetical protein
MKNLLKYVIAIYMYAQRIKYLLLYFHSQQ